MPRACGQSSIRDLGSNRTAAAYWINPPSRMMTSEAGANSSYPHSSFRDAPLGAGPESIRPLALRLNGFRARRFRVAPE